jgi:hypothetical protein
MAGNADLLSTVLGCARPNLDPRVDPGPIGRRTLWDRGASTLPVQARREPVRQRLLFRGELCLGLVLRMVRQVARVFHDGFAINP